MGIRSTLVFWAFLLCIAVWQSPGMHAVVFEDEPVVTELPENKAAGRIVPPYKVPHNKFDFSDYTQNTEFFLGSPQRDREVMFGTPERSGRFDSEGKLIFPRDPRGMH